MNNIDIKLSIGKNVKNLRKKYKLSQKEMAVIAGLAGNSSISYIEKGDSLITLESMLKLIEYFKDEEMSLDWFIRDNNIYENNSSNKRFDEPNSYYDNELGDDYSLKLKKELEFANKKIEYLEKLINESVKQIIDKIDFK